jgi:Fe-S-cluster containining protein
LHFAEAANPLWIRCFFLQALPSHSLPSLEKTMNNPTWKTPQPSPGQAPFPFACRGCGKLCCADKNVLVSPPEAARLAWHLEREGLEQAYPRSQWGVLVLGSSTGLPVLKLNFARRTEEPDGPRLCPFLDTLPGQSQHGLCRVHPARPTACRLFPLGRLFALQGERERFALLERCPGFEPAGSGETTPPGYAPAPAEQTIQSWANQAAHPEMDIEKKRYVQVLRAYLGLGLHTPTRDNPSGQLSERAALFLGPALFYRIPAAPEEPNQDHTSILDWLAALQASTGLVRALLGRSLP